MTPLPPVSVKYARNNNTRVAERVITGLIKARACAFGDANVLSLVACICHMVSAVWLSPRTARSALSLIA